MPNYEVRWQITITHEGRAVVKADSREKAAKVIEKFGSNPSDHDYPIREEDGDCVCYELEVLPDYYGDGGNIKKTDREAEFDYEEEFDEDSA